MFIFWKSRRALIRCLRCRKRDWTLSELTQYLRSWSSRARYLAQHEVDPVIAFENEVATLWGHPDQRHQVRWPVTMRAGRPEPLRG